MMMTRMALRSHIGDHDTENNVDFRVRGGVPPYCTGHTPTPPRRLTVGAPFALRKVSASQVGNFLDFDVTL